MGLGKLLAFVVDGDVEDEEERGIEGDEAGVVWDEDAAVGVVEGDVGGA